ncbi:MAG: hypothetical protein ACRC16_14050 [Aeromonas salmonicida]
MLIHEEKNPPEWQVYRVKKDHIWVCVLGGLALPHAGNGLERKQIKRATSCEVALSKRLVGWGNLNTKNKTLILIT